MTDKLHRWIERKLGRTVQRTIRGDGFILYEGEIEKLAKPLLIMPLLWLILGFSLAQLIILFARVLLS